MEWVGASITINSKFSHILRESSSKSCKHLDSIMIIIIIIVIIVLIIIIIIIVPIYCTYEVQFSSLPAASSQVGYLLSKQTSL